MQNQLSDNIKTNVDTSFSLHFQLLWRYLGNLRIRSVGLRGVRGVEGNKSYYKNQKLRIARFFIAFLVLTLNQLLKILFIYLPDRHD